MAELSRMVLNKISLGKLGHFAGRIPLVIVKSTIVSSSTPGVSLKLVTFASQPASQPTSQAASHHFWKPPIIVPFEFF